MSFQLAALLLTWAVLLALVLASAGLLRMIQDLQRRLADGALEGGSRPGPTGVTGLALPATGPGAALRPDGAGVVLFVAPGCPACGGAIELLAQRATPTVVASLGPCPEAAVRTRCVPDADALADLLQVPATPFVLAVDSAGTIRGSLLPESTDDLADWLNHMEATTR
ncbi:hypothetical protein [Janibacter sp. GXQ6167]|uniref:hypothetical protein n=1 Tax=Janibacter sp. GXQ6167 TaxID=3240791 RepID=UPI00352688B4